MALDLFKPLKEQRGVTVIVVALLISVFIGVAALAIDIGHLFIVRNELQNAADAGCLAGARFLYYEDGTAINENANQIAHDAAIVNKSERNPVEVLWSGGNGGDVERGHWSFATKTFIPNPSVQPPDLGEMSNEDLDNDLSFINAIRVRARRQDTPAVSFFASILGYNYFTLSTESIAYMGFAGTLAPNEVSQPIAICQESLLVDGRYTCTMGRVINLGWYLAGQETGGWTDFNQDSPCLSGTNPLDVDSLVIYGGNPNSIVLGQPVATNGGDIPSAFFLLRDLWDYVTGRTQPWRLTLPVVECPGADMGNCERVVGAVTIDIVWMTGSDDDPSYSEAPWTMEDPRSQTTWSSNDPDGQVRWNSFVQSFNLKTLDGGPAPYQKKAVYFLPNCHQQRPRGRTGGENFGILAKIPVLVK